MLEFKEILLFSTEPNISFPSSTVLDNNTVMLWISSSHSCGFSHFGFLDGSCSETLFSVNVQNRVNDREFRKFSVSLGFASDLPMNMGQSTNLLALAFYIKVKGLNHKHSFQHFAYFTYLSKARISKEKGKTTQDICF